MLQNDILGFETLQAFVILQINLLSKASKRMINVMKVKRYSADCQFVAVKTSGSKFCTFEREARSKAGPLFSRLRNS